MRYRHMFATVLTLVLVCAGAGYAQQTAEELYQAGLYQEEVQGDLERAVTIYQQIMTEHASNRVVAAKAQLHIGICYETLGLQEAQQAYQRVVANYGDQSDVVSQARARLAALSQHAVAVAEARGPVARMLLSGRNPSDRMIENHRGIIPSPDGRRVAYTHSEPETEGVYVRNLATGEVEQVASGPPTVDYMPPVWSADGKLLAFTERDADAGVSVIRILDLSARETRTVPVPDARQLYLVDWTRDGRYFLSTDLDRRTLELVTVADGSMATLADSVWPWQRATFSPDGRFVAYGFGASPRGPHTLSVKPVSGGPRREITKSGAQMYLHPLWSPDGRELWYEQVRPSDSGRAMKALDVGSGQVRELFSLGAGGMVSLSADGGTMAFVRPGSDEGSAEIVVAETGQADGRVVSTLRRSDGVRLRVWAPPELSPLGDQVLYTVERIGRADPPVGDIWVVGSDGTGARVLKTVPGIRHATWDPSGRFIAYTATMGDTMNTVLRVVNVATGAEHDVPVPATRSRLQLQDWSRDGRFIGLMRADYWWEYWAVQGLLEGGR